MNNDDFTEAELEALRTDPPKSRAERKRIAAELAALCKQLSEQERHE